LQKLPGSTSAPASPEGRRKVARTQVLCRAAPFSHKEKPALDGKRRGISATPSHERRRLIAATGTAALRLTRARYSARVLA